MKVVIVSGISGSGKSTYLKALEDTGYFCVDNFPLVLLKNFLDVCQKSDEKIDRCAFVIDIRMKEFFAGGDKIISELKRLHTTEVVFLDSSDQVLLRRYKETRRAHPLYNTHSIKDALKRERDLVRWLRDISDQVIETSTTTVHELRNYVLNRCGEGEQRMRINVMSFGYAYGIPLEADMAFDVRFLPNPYFVPELKEKTGLDVDVAQYIKSSKIFKTYFNMLMNFIKYHLPLFAQEGKSYLTIGIGCTGGKHRSVLITDEVAKQLQKLKCNIQIHHRDINR